MSKYCLLNKLILFVFYKKGINKNQGGQSRDKYCIVLYILYYYSDRTSKQIGHNCLKTGRVFMRLSAHTPEFYAPNCRTTINFMGPII